MNALPLHPAIVHVPLGLSLVVPLLGAGIWWASRRGWLPVRAWLLVVALQAVIVAGGYAALETGEHEEDRVERVVAESRIERHEERAELFMAGAGITLGLAALALLPLGERRQRVVAGVAVLSSVAALGLGVSLGHSGGELVYRHGAANAYVTADVATAAPRRSHDDD